MINEKPGWEEEFDSRFPKSISGVIDREFSPEQKEVLFGANSEYFGAIKNFIRSSVIPAELEAYKQRLLAGLPESFGWNEPLTRENCEGDSACEFGFDCALRQARKVVEETNL